MRTQISAFDPLPSTGPLRLRGFSVGAGLNMTQGNGDILLAAAPFAPVTCTLRPSDVVATGGGLSLFNNNPGIAFLCTLLSLFLGPSPSPSPSPVPPPPPSPICFDSKIKKFPEIAKLPVTPNWPDVAWSDIGWPVLIYSVRKHPCFCYEGKGVFCKNHKPGKSHWRFIGQSSWHCG